MKLDVDIYPRTLNGISLCTGGGGLDLGLELAVPAARSVVMVEREAFAAARLVAAIEQGLLAPAAIWSDVRTFDGRPWRGVVDSLIGGIPCQPHSHAGRRQGSLDERDLWSDARRIIVQARPWLVWIENVTGMLSAGADEVAGAERVRRDLLKLGFAVEGGLFRAREVGTSHERERLFILGVADPGCGSIQRWSDGGSVPNPQGARNPQGVQREWGRDAAGNGSETVADAECNGRRKRIAGSDAQRGQPWADQGGIAVADATSERYQGRQSGGVAGQSREGRSAKRGGGSVVNSESDGRREGWPKSGVPLGDRTSPAVSGLSLADAASSRRDEGRAVAAIGGFASGVDPYRPGIFPPGPSDGAGWTDVLERAPYLEPAIRRVADGVASRVDELRMLGNGVVPLQAAYAFRTLVTRLAEAGHAGAVELAGMMAP